MPGRACRAGRPPASAWSLRVAAQLPACVLLLAVAPDCMAGSTTVSNSVQALGVRASPLQAVAGPHELRYLGHAVAREDGRYLYTEVHRHRYDGQRWLAGSIRYVAPDGRLLGEKTLDFSADSHVPVMRYQLPGLGYEERITRVDAAAFVLARQRDGRQAQRTLPRTPGQAADAGFSVWIAGQLDTLAAGRSVSLRLAVAGQLDQYRFRISPDGQLQLGGENALRLRVRPDSALRLLVDPLEMVYGLDSRQLLRYQGPSNVLDPVSGKAYDVVISYREVPPGAPGRLPQP